jgi:myo-inositol-1(or 4)-monophosphatase
VTDLHQLAQVADQAAKIGHDLLKNHTPSTVQDKADRDTVTDLDTRIEREVRAYLQQETPDIGFLGEEEGQYNAGGHDTWVLDPIDGTSNFVHGVPLCAVSLALVRNEMPVIGVIRAPLLGLHYRAIEGDGAYGNGAKLGASTTTNLARAIISIGDYAVGDQTPTDTGIQLRLTALLAERVERVRMFGSAALDLAWVAEGRTDGTIILGAKVWDSAAGAIIAREAGAVVIDSTGNQHTPASPDTIATGPHLTGPLLATVRDSIHSR